MKSTIKNTLSFLVVLLIAAAGYFYWDFLENRQSIKDDPNHVTIKEPTDVEMKEVKAFNLPSALEGHQIIERPFYTLSYNQTHEQADWVAYTMYPFPDSISVKRKDAFRSDPLVDGGSATLKDYKKSGYDRGHLAPAKAMSISKESMRESFFMSNMSPQVGSFNRQIWRFLEAQVYKWSKESDSMYVVTGPVLESPLGTIGENKVSIPRSYYKTILRFKNNEITAIGFLLKNKKTKEKFLKFASSIDHIETITGIDFYHQLNDTLEKKLEANKEVSKFIQPIN